jgi:hypothetical protein
MNLEEDIEIFKGANSLNTWNGVIKMNVPELFATKRF